MYQDLYIIDDNNIGYSYIETCFEKEKAKFCFVRIGTENIEEKLKQIPSMIIIDEDGINVDLFDLINRINENEENSSIPKLVISSNPSKAHRIKVLQHKMLFYIRKPVEEEYLRLIIQNLAKLIYLNRGVSPLTGLPGNAQIETEMKRRLYNNEEFVVIYADLDNFKAYNDVYGFSNGDEVIKFTAKVLSENIHKDEKPGDNNFVGHIGGDDFIAITNMKDSYEVATNIIKNFDKDVLQFFTKEDIEKGYLEVSNRRGIIELFPLTSISIAIVEVKKDRFTNILEIGEVGAQVKHKAKSIQGSSVVINRRLT